MPAGESFLDNLVVRSVGQVHWTAYIGQLTFDIFRPKQTVSRQKLTSSETRTLRQSLMSNDSISSLLDHTDPHVRTILGRVLDGQELSWPDALRLCETRGLDFQATVCAADEL